MLSEFCFWWFCDNNIYSFELKGVHIKTEISKSLQERTITDQFKYPLQLSVDKKPGKLSVDWFALWLQVFQGEWNHYSAYLVLPRHAIKRFGGWDWALSRHAWHSSVCFCEAIQLRMLWKVGTVSDLGGKMVRNAEALWKLQKLVSVGISKVGGDCWREQDRFGKITCWEQAGSS